MLTIKEYGDNLTEEIDGAVKYAELYICCKINGDTTNATKYKEMANDEMKHASFFDTQGDSLVTVIKKNISDPEMFLDDWEWAKSQYAKNLAYVKRLLEK